MEDLESRLLEMVRHKDWKTIINLRDHYTLTEKSRFSWAWPSENCLKQLKTILRGNCVESVLSIGCGSGLLEWMIKEFTGLPVSGIERDHSWWTSNYSPTTFIKMHFITGSPNEQFLRDCAATKNDFALLFCYFNNRMAFDQYIREYKGKIVIIVGPKNDTNIVTDPLPLTPKFYERNEFEWNLISVVDIDDDLNVVAVYERSDLI